MEHYGNFTWLRPVPNFTIFYFEKSVLTKMPLEARNVDFCAVRCMTHSLSYSCSTRHYDHVNASGTKFEAITKILRISERQR